MINTRKDNSYWRPARKGFITNYPNFQHWKKLAMGEMWADLPLHLYVHIPFCAQKCAYCYYRTVQGSRKAEMDRYVNALCCEMAQVAETFHLKKRPVVSLYFGGGTPTFLTKEQLFQLVDTLHQNFKIEQPEFTVEGEPVTFTEKKAEALQAMQVNRISLGVQSLCDDVIKLSNRQDTEEKVLRAIAIAKSTQAVVNLDLMSGLAGETVSTWEYTIQRALATEVASITVYKMDLYANTQYFRALRNHQIELPSDEQESQFMRYALEQLERAQYLPWSFFTFTQQGRYPHVHAPSIWRGGDCYAFGTSAFGRLGNHLFQNTSVVEKYLTRVEAGQLPINRGHYLTSLDQIIRDIVLGMKLVRFNLKQFKKKHGFRLESLCAATIQQLEQDGFITLAEDELQLTFKGMLHGDYTGKSLAQALMGMY